MAQIVNNNEYNNYLKFLEDKNKNIGGPVQNLNPFNSNDNSKDNFFNDSEENK